MSEQRPTERETVEWRFFHGLRGNDWKTDGTKVYRTRTPKHLDEWSEIVDLRPDDLWADDSSLIEFFPGQPTAGETVEEIKRQRDHYREQRDGLLGAYKTALRRIRRKPPQVKAGGFDDAVEPVTLESVLAIFEAALERAKEAGI